MSQFSAKTIARYTPSAPLLYDGQESLLRVDSNSVLLISGGVYGLPQVGVQDLPLSVVCSSDSSVPVENVQQKGNSLIKVFDNIDGRLTNESGVVNITEFSRMTVGIQKNGAPLDGKCIISSSNNRINWKQIDEISFSSSFQSNGVVSDIYDINFMYLKLKWLPLIIYEPLSNSNISVSICVQTK